MKCEAAVMSSPSVRPLRGSIAASNHAGVVGSKNETRVTRCDPTVPVPSTCAFVTSSQKGCGWSRGGSCDDFSQGAVGVARSQRSPSMITDDEWPLIEYASECGATARYTVWSTFVGELASRSRQTSVRSAFQVSVAFETS